MAHLMKRNVAKEANNTLPESVAKFETACVDKTVQVIDEIARINTSAAHFWNNAYQQTILTGNALSRLYQVVMEETIKAGNELYECSLDSVHEGFTCRNFKDATHWQQGTFKRLLDNYCNEMRALSAISVKEALQQPDTNEIKASSLLVE